ncbi:potassium channel family protein [Mycobacterium neglectum]|jgi:voltage-gated potassium channel|uniref:potassium channel family protein n=1 Tax=Mycobacterium neglectum TaxID=242737 RepID=UPI000BFEB620|nr:potassium channel family protein [Mycobacterium neglectum]
MPPHPADPSYHVPNRRLDRWEHRAEWPLAGIAVVFLAVYSVQVLARPPEHVNRLLDSVNAGLYLAFVVDYLVRLCLAKQRVRWFFGHLVDLAIVVLPFLRPLRLLRLVVLFKVLQRAVGDAIRGRVIIYTASSAILLIYVASLAVLEAERQDPRSDITSLGQAVWWAITTVTTVGYGDLSPVTVTGRVIAALLMIGGISLLGVVTATLASWIVQRVAEEDEANQAATSAQIEDLRAEIKQLSDAIQNNGRARGPRSAYSEHTGWSGGRGRT